MATSKSKVCEPEAAVWYYRQVPYLSGKNKGKLHYQYNWARLHHEIDKALDWFERRRIKPTVRQIHYYFTQLKPPRIPNVKKCYQKLDEEITALGAGPYCMGSYPRRPEGNRK